MILFLIAAATIWAVGWLFRTPTQARWLLIGLLYIVTLATLLLLPDTAPLALALGPLSMWLILGAFSALIAGYVYGLRYLKTRLRPENQAPDWSPGQPAPPDPHAPLTEGELDRYARHLMLREIGGPGQRKLKQSRVLVIGAGGLGTPALQYLAAAGVGTLGIIDDDVVDVSNLHRQVLHNEARLGVPKVFSAQMALRDLNPHIAVRPYHRRLTEDIAQDLMADFDLVLDGSDNFDTRYLVNRACVAAKVPLISGAITQWEGQLSLFDPNAGSPCYQCIFPERPAPGLVPSCAEAGVVGPLPGVVGTMMAVEAMKHLTAAGTSAMGHLIFYDGLHGEHRKMRITKRTDCPVCGHVA